MEHWHRRQTQSSMGQWSTCSAVTSGRSSKRWGACFVRVGSIGSNGGNQMGFSIRFLARRFIARSLQQGLEHRRGTIHPWALALGMLVIDLL